jgi:cell division protein FtsW (lipid II flippase)
MPLLINGIILILFGFLAVYSVSIYESFSLSLCNVGSMTRIATCLAKFPEPTNYYYFYQQIKALIYIAVAVLIVWKFPLKILKSHKFATRVMIGGFLLQLLVFTPLGDSYGTIAKGWINIP